MEGTDVRDVKVSREMADSLYDLQRFLIGIEQARELSEINLTQVTEWADNVGLVIGGWQTHDVVVPGVELETISYVVYTNARRTHMMRCWRNVSTTGDLTEWTLETALRDEPGAIWRAPQHAGTTKGNLPMLRDFVDSYSDLDPGTEEIERLHPQAVA